MKKYTHFLSAVVAAIILICNYFIISGESKLELDATFVVSANMCVFSFILIIGLSFPKVNKRKILSFSFALLSVLQIVIDLLVEKVMWKHLALFGTVDIYYILAFIYAFLAIAVRVCGPVTGVLGLSIIHGLNAVLFAETNFSSASTVDFLLKSGVLINILYYLYIISVLTEENVLTLGKGRLNALIRKFYYRDSFAAEADVNDFADESEKEESGFKKWKRILTDISSYEDEDEEEYCCRREYLEKIAFVCKNDVILDALSVMECFCSNVNDGESLAKYGSKELLCYIKAVNEAYSSVAKVIGATEPDADRMARWTERLLKESGDENVTHLNFWLLAKAIIEPENSSFDCVLYNCAKAQGIVAVTDYRCRGEFFRTRAYHEAESVRLKPRYSADFVWSVESIKEKIKEYNEYFMCDVSTEVEAVEKAKMPIVYDKDKFWVALEFANHEEISLREKCLIFDVAYYNGAKECVDFLCSEKIKKAIGTFAKEFPFCEPRMKEVRRKLYCGTPFASEYRISDEFIIDGETYILEEINQQPDYSVFLTLRTKKRFSREQKTLVLSEEEAQKHRAD